MRLPKIYKGIDGNLLVYSDSSRYIQLLNGMIVKEENYERIMNERR